MKILSTNFFVNTTNAHQAAPRFRYDSPSDTFTRTTSVVTPSFKQSPMQQVAELFKQALKGTNVSPNELMMLGLATLGLTTISKDALDKLMTNFTKQKENEEESTEQVIEQINNNPQEEVMPQETNDTSNDKVAVDQIDIPEAEGPQEEKIEGLISPKFPTRRGHLTEGQIHLKEIVESIKIPSELEERLIAICKELLITKNTHKFDKDILSNSELAELLANRLREKYESFEDLKYTIDIFYEVCELNTEKTGEDNSNASEDIVPEENLKYEESEQSPKVEADKPKDNDVFRCGVPILRGPKTVGKIDLDKIPPNRPTSKKSKTTKTEKTEKTEKVATSTDVPKSTNNKSKKNKPEINFDKVVNVTLTDKKGEFIFNIPGTVDSDIVNNLKLILFKYEKEFSAIEEDPRWQCSQPSGITVTQKLILKDIKKRKDFKYIKASDAGKIVELIHSEPRLQTMFTLHGALRFIDRFINFNNEEELAEDQCKRILDCFESVVQKSLSKGLIVKSHADDEGYGYGPRVIIDPNIYDEDERDCFGTSPLVFGICEEQDPFYYNKYKKEPLITTIFTDI